MSAFFLSASSNHLADFSLLWGLWRHESNFYYLRLFADPTQDDLGIARVAALPLDSRPRDHDHGHRNYGAGSSNQGRQHPPPASLPSRTTQSRGAPSGGGGWNLNDVWKSTRSNALRLKSADTFQMPWKPVPSTMKMLPKSKIWTI